MKRFLLLIIIFSYQNSKSQTADLLNSSLAKSAFIGYKYEQAEKRKVLSLKNKRVIAKINPLNYIAAGALFFTSEFSRSKFRQVVCTKLVAQTTPS